MEKEKIALLDTDFVSKAYRSCADSERLIEKVIDLPEYKSTAINKSRQNSRGVLLTPMHG